MANEVKCTTNHLSYVYIVKFFKKYLFYISRYIEITNVEQMYVDISIYCSAMQSFVSAEKSEKVEVFRRVNACDAAKVVITSNGAAVKGEKADTLELEIVMMSVLGCLG